jgi:hypothetical protein
MSRRTVRVTSDNRLVQDFDLGEREELGVRVVFAEEEAPETRAQIARILARLLFEPEPE